MKRLVFILATSMLMASPSAFALQNNVTGSCTNKNDVPGDFVNKCALAGGSEVRCSSGTAMCCIKNAQGGVNCYDNTDDVKRKDPKAGAGQPTPGRLAPSPAPKTAPRQKAPGTLAPVK